MKISFTLEPLFSEWSVQQTFNKYVNWFIENHDYDVEIIDSSKFDRSNPSGIYSPHVLTIRNLENKKYIIVSYWDRAIELMWNGNGWDSENCVDIITSAGVHYPMNFTPSSYLAYSSTHENLANIHRTPFNEKVNKRLFFRGFLYGNRLEMSKFSMGNIVSEKLPIFDYMRELGNNKIGLSLNGAGEICNRDIEILSVGSALLRPRLKQKFHNELIPDFHYIAVDLGITPKSQWDLIMKKYNEVKENEEFLYKISENGLKWYYENGTIDSNVEILKKVININKLI